MGGVTTTTDGMVALAGGFHGDGVVVYLYP